MQHAFRYPWPASAIGGAEMAMLHLARESSPDKTSIVERLAHAVRVQYGHLAVRPLESTTQPKETYAHSRQRKNNLEENQGA